MNVKEEEEAIIVGMVVASNFGTKVHYNMACWPIYVQQNEASKLSHLCVIKYKDIDP